MSRPLTPAEIEAERQALVRAGVLVVADAKDSAKDIESTSTRDEDIEFLKSFVVEAPKPAPKLEASKALAKAPAPGRPVGLSVRPSVARKAKSKDKFSDFLNNDEALTLAQLKSFTPQQQANIKSLIQSNVWFGAQKIFRSSSQPPLEPFHQDIANALPQPDPELPLAEWSELKEAVVLAFRGAAKTTITSGYVVQCILCDPDIRVKFVGGTLSKAAELVDMVRFHLNGNEVIRFLFPDFGPVSTSGNEFTVPNRKDMGLRDSTLASTSFRAQNAGGRADLLILDDAATEANMSSPTRVAKSVAQYDDLAPMVEPGGYTIFNGTRWDADDIPASIAAAAQEQGHDLTWLEIPVWTLKEGPDIKQRDETNTLNPEDVDITWPKLSADFLFRMYRKNPDAFNKQYLLRVDNAPTAPFVGQSAQVTPELLASRVIQSRLPSEAETFVLNADLASVSEEGKDPCCIVSGVWNPAQQHLTIDRIILKKFEEEKVFLGAVRGLYESAVIQSSNAVRFRIENVREAKNLWAEKFQAASINAEFLYPSYERGAREKRVTKLFEAIHANQVHFGHACNRWEDIVAQFCGYNPRKSAGRADDVLDSVAQLYEYCLTITALKFVGFPMLANPGHFDFDYSTDTPGDKFHQHQSRRQDEANQKSAAEYFDKEHGGLVNRRRPDEDFSL